MGHETTTTTTAAVRIEGPNGPVHELEPGEEVSVRLGAHPCRLRHAGASLTLTSNRPVRYGRIAVSEGELPLQGRLDGPRGSWCTWRPVEANDDDGLPGMLGSSVAMRELARWVRRLALATELPVLVRGPSGVGKELVAQALHALGPRAQGPFVAINGATLSAALGGSQLFGHVRGAFTGADQARQGAMRSADGGTLFIDEVGALCAHVQAALLRALEEGRLTPVGADAEVPVDVRIVSATCEPLEQAVEEGRFRRDLYQRLATTVVRVPPLSDRLDDIPVLARHLLDRHGFGHMVLTPGATSALVGRRYRGHVRELRNTLVQAALLAERPCLVAREDVERAWQARHGATDDGGRVGCAGAPHRDGRSGRRNASSCDPSRVLAEHHGNRSAAARALGVPRSTFRDWLRKCSPEAAVAGSATPTAAPSSAAAMTPTHLALAS